MDFSALANLSWREALIAIIAMLVLYILVVFFRMRRLRREKMTISVAAQSAVNAYAAALEPELPPDLPADKPASLPAERAFPWNEPPPEIPGQQMIEALERDLSRLRGEVATLRAELADAREEVRRELAQARASHNVSPLYSDAMDMAMQGHDAATISEHCGIARAEAELVVSLVRNRETGN